MDNIRTVSVQDVLIARDERLKRQTALRARHHLPLVSFTMNIAGEIKRSPLIERAFEEGLRRIRRRLERMDCAAADCEITRAFTGCEALWAVRGDAGKIKQGMCLIEEADALGRLFDIDVIDENGVHLTRGTERTCLICGGPVRACARSRAHSGAELYEKANQIIRAHFEERFIQRVGELAQKALVFEALTTPKPGLVDCENNGAHSDMDLFSFASSVCALRPYFERCVRLGMDNAGAARLQHEGMQAEDDMFAAAQANTHKGAVFSLGILCYALGSAGENADPDEVLTRAAQVGQIFLNEMKDAKHPRTGGETQYLQYGLTGARGEAASGFPSVRTIALPALEKALQEGRCLPDAGLCALLALISQVQDSNIIRRAGMNGQRLAAQQAEEWLQNGFDKDALRAMNDRFVAENLSPGGSADLLAAAYFLHFWQTDVS